MTRDTLATLHLCCHATEYGSYATTRPPLRPRTPTAVTRGALHGAARPHYGNCTSLPAAFSRLDITSGGGRRSQTSEKSSERQANNAHGLRMETDERTERPVRIHGINHTCRARHAVDIYAMLTRYMNCTLNITASPYFKPSAYLICHWHQLSKNRHKQHRKSQHLDDFKL